MSAQPIFARSLAVWLILSIAPAVAEPSGGDDSRRQRRIELPEIAESELISVTLDDELFRATADDYSDIRLVDDELAAVPFLLRTAVETRLDTRRHRLVSESQNARPLDDGGLEIVLKLAADKPPLTGLRLVSPLSNFEHSVQVFASPDGQDWTSLADDELIFDYSRFIDVRRDTVSVTATSDRWIRIVIDDVTDEQESRLLELTRDLRLDNREATSLSERLRIDRRPFRIDRIELWSDVPWHRVNAIRRAEFAVSDFRLEHDPKERRSMVEFRTDRQPLTRVMVETESRNFHRPVRLETVAQDRLGERWNTLASGVLSQLDFKDLQQSDLEIEFPATRQDRYRLVIENGDNPPLDVTAIEAEGTLVELIFLAGPDSAYHLVYGGDSLKKPRYDTVAITAALEAGFEPQPATLGPSAAATLSDEAMAIDWAERLNDRRILLGTITLLVIVLGWFLYHAAKRVDGMTEAASEPQHDGGDGVGKTT